MLKKTVSLLSASAVLVVSALAWINTVSAATNDPEFAKALTWMNQNGYTMYNNEDAFRPFSTLRRDEAAKFISTFATTVLSGCRQYEVKGCDFADASDINPSLTSSVKTACEYGLMIGSVSNGARYFYPTANVTKAQFVTTMVRAYEGLKDENGTPWFVNYYNSAITRGIITQAANPTASVLDKNLTRYEAGLMLYRASSMGCTSGSTTTTSTGSTTVVNNGTVSVSLAANSNAGVNGTIYIPKSSTNNRVLSLDLVSTNGTARVDTITLTMDDSLMDRNAAMVSIVDENGVKLTNTRSFNSNNEAILTFTSPLILDSKVRNFTVMFDFSGSVNQRTVVGVKNVTSSGSTMNVSNVMSKYINTVDISSSANRITISTVGGTLTSAAPCTTSSSFVYIGETNKLLGRFTLDYTSSNNKSAVVTSIRFKSTKALAGIVSNLKLVVGTGTASTNAVIDTRYVTFTFGSGFVMPYGSSKSFYIYGDVVGGQANDAIELYVENNGDVAAYELSANMIALNTIKSTSSTYTTLYCIKEGTNSITRIDGLSATNIPTREQMIQGLVANVNTKSSIKVDKIKLWTTDTNTASGSVNPANDIENVRLYINGILVDSTSTVAGSAGAYYYEIGAYRDLNAGANTVEVRFDTKSTATVGNTVTFNLDPSSFVFNGNATYNVSQNNVLLADFNGSANGARLIIKNPGIDNISLTDSTTNLTRVKESADFGAIQFGLRPSNVRDIVLNGFKLNIVSFSGVANAANSNFVTDATVVVDGKEIQTVSFSQGLSATFNSLGIIISKSSSKDIYVKVKTTSTHPDGGVNDVMYSVSSFDIQDINGNSINTVNGVPTSAYVLPGNPLDVAPAILINCSFVQIPWASTSVTSSASGTIIGSYKFKSNYGASALRELAIANVTPAGAVVSPTTTLVSSYNSTTVANGTNANFTNSADGTILVASVNGTEIGRSTIYNGIAYISNINGWIGQNISTNDTVTVVIRAIAPTDKTSWVLTLRLIDPNLNTTALLEGSAQTLVSAVNSNSSVGGSCTSSTSTPVYIRKGNLVVSNVSSVSLKETTLVAWTTLFSTTITADSANDAIVKKISFNVVPSSLVTLWAKDFALKVWTNAQYNNITEADCNYASNVVTCEFVGSYADWLTIAASSSVKFTLLVDKNNTAWIDLNTVSSTVKTLWIGFTQKSSDWNAYVYASVPTPTSLVWSDQSLVNHSLTTADWYTDKSVTWY